MQRSPAVGSRGRNLLVAVDALEIPCPGEHDLERRRPNLDDPEVIAKTIEMRKVREPGVQGLRRREIAGLSGPRVQNTACLEVQEQKLRGSFRQATMTSR